MLITQNGRNGIDTVRKLQDEMVLYCAMDVELLHKIYATLRQVFFLQSVLEVTSPVQLSIVWSLHFPGVSAFGAGGSEGPGPSASQAQKEEPEGYMEKLGLFVDFHRKELQPADIHE